MKHAPRCAKTLIQCSKLLPYYKLRRRIFADSAVFCIFAHKLQNCVPIYERQPEKRKTRTAVPLLQTLRPLLAEHHILQEDIRGEPRSSTPRRHAAAHRQQPSELYERPPRTRHILSRPQAERHHPCRRVPRVAHSQQVLARHRLAARLPPRLRRRRSTRQEQRNLPRKRTSLDKRSIRTDVPRSRTPRQAVARQLQLRLHQDGIRGCRTRWIREGTLHPSRLQPLQPLLRLEEPDAREVRYTHQHQALLRTLQDQATHRTA